MIRAATPTATRRSLLAAGGGAVAALVAGCGGEPEPATRLRFATGAVGGPYNAFGRALARAAGADGRRLAVVPLATAASVDNLRRLDAGSAELALTMADAAEDAVLGRELFLRRVEVTALARVYVNHTHVVVPARGPVRALGQLAGRPVAAGASGSGAQIVAERLLRAAGLTGSRAVRARQMEAAESAVALRDGEVDALIWSGGVPTPLLADLAREIPLRFLALDGHVAELRAAYGPVYSAVTIPAGAYGLREPVGTIGVSNYLAARADVPEGAVRELLALVFDRRRVLLAEVTAGARLEPRFAISTGNVPLHPGAAAYYRSVFG